MFSPKTKHLGSADEKHINAHKSGSHPLGPQLDGIYMTAGPSVLGDPAWFVAPVGLPPFVGNIQLEAFFPISQSPTPFVAIQKAA